MLPGSLLSESYLVLVLARGRKRRSDNPLCVKFETRKGGAYLDEVSTNVFILNLAKRPHLSTCLCWQNTRDHVGLARRIKSAIISDVMRSNNFKTSIWHFHQSWRGFKYSKKDEETGKSRRCYSLIGPVEVKNWISVWIVVTPKTPSCQTMEKSFTLNQWTDSPVSLVPIVFEFPIK